MEFEYSDRSKALRREAHQVHGRDHLSGREGLQEQIEAAKDRWQLPPVMEELKLKRKKRGLWNMFLRPSESGERTARGPVEPRIRAAVRNHGPLLGRVGSDQLLGAGHRQHGNHRALRHRRSTRGKWLEPLLRGEIRSGFAMTEPAVASSDATNIETRIERDGDDYVINGHKWWISGAGDPRCAVFILMGKTDPDGAAPRAAVDDPGAGRHARASPSSGRCRCSATTTRRTAIAKSCSRTCGCRRRNILLGEGRGFEIAQGRLGPGRIHHCMRAIGVAERALELMCKRLNQRIAFGRRISEQGVWRERIAESRIQIDTRAC